jgi:hypothetical protein
MRCLGREIHPDFRENYCGKKRIGKGFPCDDCDLNSDNKEKYDQLVQERKAILQKVKNRIGNNGSGE